MCQSLVRFINKLRCMVGFHDYDYMVYFNHEVNGFVVHPFYNSSTDKKMGLDQRCWNCGVKK